MAKKNIPDFEEEYDEDDNELYVVGMLYMRMRCTSSFNRNASTEVVVAARQNEAKELVSYKGTVLAKLMPYF